MYRSAVRLSKPQSENIKHKTGERRFFPHPQGIINSRLRCSGLLTSREVNEIRPGGTKTRIRLVKEKLPSLHKGLCQMFEV